MHTVQTAHDDSQRWHALAERLGLTVRDASEAAVVRNMRGTRRLPVEVAHGADSTACCAPIWPVLLVGLDARQISSSATAFVHIQRLAAARSTDDRLAREAVRHGFDELTKSGLAGWWIDLNDEGVLFRRMGCCFDDAELQTALAATEWTALRISELAERAAAAPWRQSVAHEWRRAAERLGAQLHEPTSQLVWPRPSARVGASIRFRDGAPVTLITVDFGEAELEPNAGSLAAAFEQLGGTLQISGSRAEVLRSGIVGNCDALAGLLEATADLARELALERRAERGPYRSDHG